MRKLTPYKEIGTGHRHGLMY